MDKKVFDYIVIGAGTTGCVIASRLSENPDINVLVLEAGDRDQKPAFHNSDLRSVFSTWNTEADWQYVTEAESYSGGRKIPITQGKVLGGSSSVNAMIHIRGSRQDYDYWNYLGNEGWSYTQVLPYFKKSENCIGIASNHRGVDGPINVIEHTNLTSAARAFLKGAFELEYNPWDLNRTETFKGAGAYQFAHTKEGKRCSAAVAYLHPAMHRPNLTVQTQAQVTRLLLKGKRVVGVEYFYKDTLHQVMTQEEVIVSAGSFASPKLLMLSGIGSANHLKNHDIPIVVDLPGVGQNLQDHLLVRMQYSCKITQSVPAVFAEVGLLTHSRRDMENTAPELQFLFTAINLTDEGVSIGGKHLLCCPTLLRPQSRGNVTLRSQNYQAPPVVRTNYLQCDIDTQVLINGIEIARNLMKTEAMSEIEPTELTPGVELTTKQELRKYIRDHCFTEWHPTSTCKMGRDVMSVVDPQLRVYGIERLRVADASIMPTITSANPNATCLMIGEKASDTIIRSQASRHTFN